MVLLVGVVHIPHRLLLLPLLAGDVVVLGVIISGVKIGNRQIAAIVLMAQVHVLLLVKGVVAVL